MADFSIFRSAFDSPVRAKFDEFINIGMCMETEDQTYGRFWPARKDAVAYTFVGTDGNVYKVFKQL